MMTSSTLFLDIVAPYELSTFTALLGDVGKDEVITAINQLNSNKTPGPDGLPAEFYKLGLDDFINLLTSVFNKGLKNGVMSDSFYHGVMCLLHKKGDKDNLDNYRHLTIMNADYKILAKIIMNRLNDVLDLIIDKEKNMC